MKWFIKSCAISLLCCISGCGDAQRENSNSRPSALVEPSKVAPSSTAFAVKPKQSEAEMAASQELRKQQESIAEVAFDKIDAMSTSAPEFAESLVSFWNEYQATASPSTR